MTTAHFETAGIHGKYSDNVIREIDYQRNGVTGEGFYVVRFLHVPFYDGVQNLDDSVELLGIVFADHKRCAAVVNPRDLTSHYRGDSFEDGLRIAIKAWEASR
jgi:hypothetical protein